MKRIFLITVAFITLLSPSFGRAQSTRREVHPKETLYSIAKACNTTVEELYRLNPDLRKRELQSGEYILIPEKKIPASGRNATGTPVGEKTYTVQRGETMYAIARKFNIAPADLLGCNPGINADNLAEGQRLFLPAAAEKPGSVLRRVSASQIPMMQYGSLDTVRISLILPLSGNAPPRYLSFYQGFLMGLNDLKRGGISVILHTYNAGSGEVKRLLRSGNLLGEHMIIGGTEIEDIEALTDYAAVKGINYLIPFNSQAGISSHAPTVFQINPAQEDLFPYVVKGFEESYKHRNITFVNIPGGKREPLPEVLMQGLRKSNVAFSTLSLENMSSLPEGSVIVPTSSDFQSTSALLEKLDSRGLQPVIFGYPSWQSFPNPTKKRLGKYRTTIYSSFYFDEAGADAKSFIARFSGWYGRNLHPGYPKYSVLGYDVARYFVRALAAYGNKFSSSLAQIPSDGIQTDFYFKRINNRGGFVNMNVFFIRTDPSGAVHRTSIVN